MEKQLWTLDISLRTGGIRVSQSFQLAKIRVCVVHVRPTPECVDLNLTFTPRTIDASKRTDLSRLESVLVNINSFA
jgi:hypothetical protein